MDAVPHSASHPHRGGITHSRCVQTYQGYPDTLIGLEFNADYQVTAPGYSCRATHPEAVVELRVHQAICERCEEETQRQGILVTITVGELTLAREYAAP